MALIEMKEATFEGTDYDELVQFFGNTTIPVFFSEHGCNDPAPRVFNEVGALYGPQMRGVLSGGIIYEYVQEENNYGLVDLYDNGTAKLREDFDALQEQYNQLDIQALQSGNSSATRLQSPECSGDLISDANDFSKSFRIPTLPEGAQDMIDNGIENPNIGEIVPVNDVDVEAAVYGSKGGRIEDLRIEPLPEDQSNTPNGQDTSGSTDASGTSTASDAEETSGGRYFAKIDLILGGLAAFLAIVTLQA